MANSKVIPLLLIGGGVAAGVYAMTRNNTPSYNPYQPGNNTPATTDNSGNIFSRISDLIAVITGGVAAVSTALKAKGTITGTQRVLISGTGYTGLNVTSTKNLKAGEKITITGTGLPGTFTVKQLGNDFGSLKDSLIVIDKLYDFNVTVTGTYQEI